MVYQLWDESQGIIHMTNAVMLPFLHLLGAEDFHGMFLSFHDFETKDDLRVSVETCFCQRVQSDLKLFRVEMSQLQIQMVNMEIKIIYITKGGKYEYMSTETVQSKMNIRLCPYQDVHFLYTHSYLIALQSCA